MRREAQMKNEHACTHRSPLIISDLCTRVEKIPPSLLRKEHDIDVVWMSKCVATPVDDDLDLAEEVCLFQHTLNLLRSA